MKKRLILLGLGLAVVGTGMIVKKLRNKKNNEVEETIETEEVMDTEIVEEVIENEVEEIVVDNDEEIEILDCEETKTNKLYDYLKNKYDKLYHTATKHVENEYYEYQKFEDNICLAFKCFRKERNRRLLKLKYYIKVTNVRLAVIRFFMNIINK